jgi:anti-anti-sigma factor
VVVVSVSGEIDSHTAPQLLKETDSAVADPACRTLVIDLTEVGFLGSAGLKALVDMQTESAGRDVALRIVVGENRHVRRPLEVTTLDTYLPLVASLDEAAGQAGPGGQE